MKKPKTATKAKPPAVRQPARQMQTTVEVQQEGKDMVALIERAIFSPEIDVIKMEKLLDINERVMRKNAEIAFNNAMANVQDRLPIIQHDARLVHKDKVTGKETVVSTYAKYETIDKKIRPIYTPQGFSVRYTSRKNEKGNVTYTATLSHREGHSEKAEIDLPADVSGSKNNIQAIGSTIKYAQRYLLSMLFNIVTEGDMSDDDDGKAVNGGGSERTSKFEQRAQRDAERGQAVDVEHEEIDEEGGGESELAEIGNEWDGKTIQTGKGKTSVKDFASPKNAAAFLKAIMLKHNSKTSRADLVSLNMPLIQRLRSDGDKDVVAELHALADAGE